MKWLKKGIIIDPNKLNLDWIKTHAMVPVADYLSDNIFRVYFSGRDKKNRSLIAYVDIDIKNPSKMIAISKQPVLGLGKLGCFDDNGVTPSWIVNYKNYKYLYYIGWNKGATVRMHIVAGLSISNNGGDSFQRVLNVPILDRTHEEPYTLNTGPCVLFDDGHWRMWYVSGVEWVHHDLPRYNIKYAESNDGIKWKRDGHICIDFKKGENALARPCVIKEDKIYKMWYSYKGSAYRIGYAESNDGLYWQRKDNEANIDISKSGWDSEMIEYSFVFKHKNKKYMLYNGNNYGYDGIGLAVEEK